MSDLDISKMKVADLKRELKQRGLSTVGVKDDLIDRLQTALLENDISLDDLGGTDDALEDDVLSEDEAKLFDESDLLENDNELTVTPSPTSIDKVLADTDVGNKDLDTKKSTCSAKRKLLESPTADEKKDVPKVIVRFPALNTDIIETVNNNIHEITATINAAIGSKKLQLSEMSLAERMALRAKRFRIQSCENSCTKKNGVSSPAPKPMGPVGYEEADKLVKRAERFGCVVSLKAADVLAKERLQKRKERFISGTTSGETKTIDIDVLATTTNDAKKDDVIVSVPKKIRGSGEAMSNVLMNSTDDYAERARKRLERFNAKPVDS